MTLKQYIQNKLKISCWEAKISKDRFNNTQIYLEIDQEISWPHLTFNQLQALSNTFNTTDITINVGYCTLHCYIKNPTLPPEITLD